MQMQPHPPSEPMPDQVLSKLTDVEAVAAQTFPEVLNPLKAALAVAAVGCLGDNTLPTALVFVGASGAGKTLASQLLLPKDDADPLNAYVYRTDKFTQAALVSHISDRTNRELKRIDMLPRIENKTFVTPELSPFFRGREHELAERFAMIARLLDGQGLVTDSGVYGQRGYARPINFQWIGATTPLSEEAIKLMAGVGPRMVFYGVDRPRKSLAELAELARSPSGPRENQLHYAVREFLLLFYAAYPPRSVPTSEFLLTEGVVTKLALWAEVLGRLRGSIQPGSSTGPRTMGDLEYPERVLSLLRNIAVGSALIHTTVEVGEFDIWQVGHIALSSGVPRRSAVFRALLEKGGRATSADIERLAGISRPTVIEGMKDLHAVGLAEYEDGTPRTAGVLRLVEDYEPLVDNSTPGGER